MLHRGLRILNKNGNDLKQQISSKYIRKYGIDAIEKVVGKDAVNRLVNSIDDIKSIDSPISNAINPTSSEKWQWNYCLDSTPMVSSEELQKLSRTQDPFQLVERDIYTLSGGIKDLLGSDHPVLATCAKYFFEIDGGKKIRPTMVLIMAYALNSQYTSLPGADSAHLAKGYASPSQKRLAEITEMIHTASLFHDDVIDKASTRRGVPSVNQIFGNKLAILGGDFLLARASVALSRLRNLEVVELLSTVIEHLVKGEVMQMRPSPSDTSPLETYLRKNFYKTASLMAHSCLASAVLGGCNEEIQRACYLYGAYVGQAFQLIDDSLDFEGSIMSLGKAPLADLKSGIATAPTLFAAQEFPRLTTLINRKFESPGDIDEALILVQQSNGLQRCKLLAQAHAEKALEAINILPPSIAKDCLIALACKVVTRSH